MFHCYIGLEFFPWQVKSFRVWRGKNTKLLQNNMQQRTDNYRPATKTCILKLVCVFQMYYHFTDNKWLRNIIYIYRRATEHGLTYFRLHNLSVYWLFWSSSIIDKSFNGGIHVPSSRYQSCKDKHGRVRTCSEKTGHHLQFLEMLPSTC